MAYASENEMIGGWVQELQTLTSSDELLKEYASMMRALVRTGRYSIASPAQRLGYMEALTEALDARQEALWNSHATA